MKKLFTLIALLAMCVSGAWADQGDKTTNVDIDFSNTIVTSSSTPKYKIEGTVGSMKWDNQWTTTPSIEDGRLKFGNFTGSVALEDNNIQSKDTVTISFEIAFGKLSNKHVGFVLKDKTGGTILTQYFDAFNGDFDDSNPLGLSWDGMYRGSNTVIADRCVYFTIKLNYSNNKIYTHTRCYLSGTSKAATEKDFEASMPSTNVIGFFELTGNINNDSRYSTFDNLKIITTEGDNSVATANYNVEYKCGDLVLKDAVTRSGDVGATTSVQNADKVAIWKNGVKYIYASDNSSSKTIASDGSTVVTVTFREAETYSYTANNSLGTTIASGSTFEGESVTVQYPQYILKEGTMYGINANASGDYWGVTFTPDQNDYVKTITYTDSNIKNVVYLTEAESISGVTAAANTARASNGKMGYTTNNSTYKEVTTLAPGRYQIYARGVNGNNATRTCNFKIGENVAWAFNIVNGVNVTGNSEEINVISESTLSFACDGSSASGCDYFYIVKTGDASTSISVSEASYTTYYNSTLAYTMPANMEGYVWNEGLKQEYAAGEIVPANTALVLKAAQGDYTITFTGASAKALTQANALLGTDEATELTADDNYYFYGLSLNAAGETNSVGFYWMNETGAAFTNGAHKAYLKLAKGGSARGAYLFNEETTGIDLTPALSQGEGAGKYLENGRIVIVKNGKKFNVNGQIVK